jgi:hypothetical protein
MTTPEAAQPTPEAVPPVAPQKRKRVTCGERGGRLPSGEPCPGAHGLHVETGLCWQHRLDWAPLREIDRPALVALLARVQAGETTLKDEAPLLGVTKGSLTRFLMKRFGEPQVITARDTGWKAVQRRRREQKATQKLSQAVPEVAAALRAPEDKA